MRQSANPHGDWGARSSQPHKKPRSCRHNGHNADFASQESLSSDHAASFEQLDPISLDARLAEAEGHIAYYHAVSGGRARGFEVVLVSPRLPPRVLAVFFKGAF